MIGTVPKRASSQSNLTFMYKMTLGNCLAPLYALKINILPQYLPRKKKRMKKDSENELNRKDNPVLSRMTLLRLRNMGKSPFNKT